MGVAAQGPQLGFIHPLCQPGNRLLSESWQERKNHNEQDVNRPESPGRR
jgi:hypothetical protein